MTWEGCWWPTYFDSISKLKGQVDGVIPVKAPPWGGTQSLARSFGYLPRPWLFSQQANEMKEALLLHRARMTCPKILPFLTTRDLPLSYTPELSWTGAALALTDIPRDAESPRKALWAHSHLNLFAFRKCPPRPRALRWSLGRRRSGLKEGGYGKSYFRAGHVSTGHYGGRYFRTFVGHALWDASDDQMRVPANFNKTFGFRFLYLTIHLDSGGPQSLLFFFSRHLGQ